MGCVSVALADAACFIGSAAAAAAATFRAVVLKEAGVSSFPTLLEQQQWQNLLRATVCFPYKLPL